MNEPHATPSKTVVVAMADMAVSDDVTAELATFSLGSCLGLAIYDAAVHVGGLLHFMLPDSTIDPIKGREAPFMFADTGIPLLFRTAYQLGADKSRIVIHVAGGAETINQHAYFNIGKRNCDALRQILDRNGVRLCGQCVGGHVSRTVRLNLADGSVTVKSRDEEIVFS